MIIVKDCTTCKTPHPDHLECDKCGAFLSGGLSRPSTQVPGGGYVRWQYCPHCGEELYIHKVTFTSEKQDE